MLVQRVCPGPKVLPFSFKCCSASQTQAISLKNFTCSTVKKMSARSFVLMKTERRRESSVELRDVKMLSWIPDGSLLSLLKTSETSTLVVYRCISNPTGIVSGTKSSNWLCLGRFRFEGKCDTVRLVLTLGWPRFHEPWTSAVSRAVRLCFQAQ